MQAMALFILIFFVGVWGGEIESSLIERTASEKLAATAPAVARLLHSVY